MNNLSALEKAKSAKKEYMRRWRAEHKDLIKASQQRYWEKKYEELSMQN